MKSTPDNRIRAGLRRLFLYSPERYEVVKRDKNTCQACGVKGTAKKGQEVKIQVHHKKGIGNWSEVIKLIRKELLCSPDYMECLCYNCHKRADLDRKGEEMIKKIDDGEPKYDYT